MSKVMVSIESPFMVSYLTSVVCNIVSLVVFEISDAEVLWPGQGWFKVIQGQRSWCQSIAHGRLPIHVYWPQHRICHRFWHI